MGNKELPLETVERVARAIETLSTEIDNMEMLDIDCGLTANQLREIRAAIASMGDDGLREALAGLVKAVEMHCNEPGGGGISGYLGARLSDARTSLGTDGL